MKENNVLIVTSNSRLAAGLMRALAESGLNTQAVTGTAGFSPLGLRGYSMVLLDFDCLGMSRLSSFKNLLPRLGGVPAIALCDLTWTTNRDIADILRAGADDVIAKSAAPALLAAKVRAHLRRASDNDRAAARWLESPMPASQPAAAYA